MSHHYRFRQPWIFVLLLFFVVTLLATLTPVYPTPIALAEADHSAATQSVIPLPRRCMRFTPPGEPEATCCINGYVFIDGQPVAGAEVQIQSPRGDQVTLTTQTYNDPSSLPSYGISLSAPPLNILPGETITVTARYGGHSRSIAYTVQPGSQTVDVVLARNYATDHALTQTIALQNDPSTFDWPRDIAVDANEFVYVADTDNHRIQVFTRDGAFVRQWGAYGSRIGQFISPSAVVVDQSLNVYVLDTGNKRVQKFDNKGTFLFEWGSSGTGNGQFTYPSDMAIGPDENLAIIDSSRILIFSSSGTWIRTFPVSQNAGNVAIDRDGYIYVTDWTDERIYGYSPTGTRVQIIGGPGTLDGQFYFLGDIAFDSSGEDLWVTDNQRIQRFTRFGTWRGSWPTFSTGQSGSLAVTQSGNIYLTAYDRVMKLASNGDILQEWGSLSKYRELTGLSVTDDGSIFLVNQHPPRVTILNDRGQEIRTLTSNPVFQYLMDIAKAPDGSIYVLDGNGHRVFKFTSDGLQLLTFGSSGTGPGQLVFAQALAVDPNGDIYVADSWGDRVVKFSSSGAFLFGWGITGSAIGQFQHPGDITVDSQGFVYVADYGNNRIQVFDSTGSFLRSWYRNFDAHPSNVKYDTIKIGPQDRLFSNYMYSDFFGIGSTTGDLVSLFGKDNGNIAAWDIRANHDLYAADKTGKRIQIFSPMTYTQPIATITHVSALSLGQGDTLTMYGMGQDSDESSAITDYEWTSDGEVIGTSAVLNRDANAFNAGTHRIALRVRDDEGQWSEAVTEEIYVAPTAEISWTMLLYLAGDYNDRGQLLNSYTKTIAALERNLRNPLIRIAIQVDGPLHGDTRRITIEPGGTGTLPTVRKEAFGEQRMDDPTTLSDFIRWGQGRFPANNYYLAIANHGQGVQGIAWDSTSNSDGSAYLTIQELGEALSAPNIAPITILHLDACSMNLLEVAFEVHQSAQILIASQYLGWSYFAYDQYQAAFTEQASTLDIARGITSIYAARAQADDYPFTIAALDLSRTESLLNSVDSLAAELAALVNNDTSNTYKNLLRTIWQASQQFDSNGDLINNDEDMYVDLLDWTNRIQIGISSPAIKQRAASVITELTGPQPFVVAGSNKAKSAFLPPEYGVRQSINLGNSNGVSIFYPQRQTTRAFDDYINNRLFAFTSASRWPDFLVAGVDLLPPGSPLEPLPGPLLPLSPAQKIFLPLIVR